MKSVPQEWQQQFANSVGNWAFVLTLSRRMVFVLEFIRDNKTNEQNPFLKGTASILGPRSGHWIPCYNSVQKRGLVEHWVRDGRSSYRLTPAGEAVCKLCEYAGVMSPAKGSRAIKAA